MHASVLLTALSAMSASALPSVIIQERGAEPVGHEWIAPGPGAVRSPCPLLNTMANHGFIARDGKNIDMQMMISGIGKGINFDPLLITTLGASGFSTSTTGNASTFNLDDLKKHNVVEHDGSLSRADFDVTGDALHFDPNVWNPVMDFLELNAVEDKIDYTVMAKARLQRFATAKATNPKFNLTTKQTFVAWGEAAVLMGMLARNFTNPVVPLDYFRFIFEMERLPYQLGWTPMTSPGTVPDTFRMEALLASVNASSSPTITHDTIKKYLSGPKPVDPPTWEEDEESGW